MDKTPGQVARNTYFKNEAWERLNREARDEWEAVAAAVIAHARPQIESEARACAVDDVISALVALYDDLLEGDKEYLRKLATLPSGFVVVPVEPTEAMLSSLFGHVTESTRNNPRFEPVQESRLRHYKAMIAARAGK